MVAIGFLTHLCTSDPSGILLTYASIMLALSVWYTLVIFGAAQEAKLDNNESDIAEFEAAISVQPVDQTVEYTTASTQDDSMPCYMYEPTAPPTYSEALELSKS